MEWSSSSCVRKMRNGDRVLLRYLLARVVLDLLKHLHLGSTRYLSILPKNSFLLHKLLQIGFDSCIKPVLHMGTLRS